MLKKKGMKTTGKKATLMKRLHLKGGATKAVRDAAIAAAKAMPETNDAEKAAKATALAEAEAMMEEEDPPKDPNAMDVEGPTAGRRRRRSRRREEGGRRRTSRRVREKLGY
jgi:hypothetical protein